MKIVILAFRLEAFLISVNLLFIFYKNTGFEKKTQILFL